MKLLCLLLALTMTLLSACAPETETKEVLGTPAPLLEAGMAYAAEIEQTCIDFTAAYFGGDIEAIREMLTDDYSCGMIEAYPMDKDTVVIGDIKGVEQAAEDYAATGACVVSVEFRETDTADFYTYLTIEMQQDEAGPGVCFYGLEK